MAYVITQSCCKDASCVPVCPVDCIRPTAAPDAADMLYIDPQTCIDCGACMQECPVDAIYPADALPQPLARFRDINAGYFQRHPLGSDDELCSPPTRPEAPGPLRVAIVGAGPAACYAAAELVAVKDVEIELFERLPTPFGLIRSGVAPDHQDTKAITTVFEQTLAHRRVRCHFNVEIGDRLTHADLMAHHHAVIYGVGASVNRRLGIPGEDLPGMHSAADFVGWYNGHPDHAGRQFDFRGERAVIIGNGNVALDIARMLLLDREHLAATDIAEHALEALSHSTVREVVILGRRGPREAAFSVGEFLELGVLDGIDVEIDGDVAIGPDDSFETATKLALAAEYSRRTPTPGNRRIVFRFHTCPVEAVGRDRLERLRVTRYGVPEDIETTLVLRSIGTDATLVPGLARVSGRVPNDGGRVLDTDGGPVAGVYVTGWAKRGPQGVIGTNRSCAAETVSHLLADHAAGILDREVLSGAALAHLMSDRGLQTVSWSGWGQIDEAERRRGDDVGRPRVKFVDVQQMLDAARACSLVE